MVKLFSGTPLSQFGKPAVAVAKPRATVSTSAPQTTAQSVLLPLAGGSKTRLVPVGRLANGGRWRVEAMRAYSEPVLLWFTRGQGRITVGGITRGYGAHNAIIPREAMLLGHAPALTLGEATAAGEFNLTPIALDRNWERWSRRASAGV